jgi:ProP effector
MNTPLPEADATSATPNPEPADAPRATAAEDGPAADTAHPEAPAHGAAVGGALDAALGTTAGQAPDTRPIEAEALAAEPQAASEPTPGQPKLPDLGPAECAQALKAQFPALFEGPAKPVKLRIQADIQARAPGVFSKKSLSIFLHRHTNSTAYLLALTQAPHRFDLDGAPAGEISEEHRQVAQEEVKRRRAIQQEKRAALAKAQHDARLEARKAERAQERQAQQEKKAQDDAMFDRMRLLRAFETTTLTRANFCALKGVKEAELDALLAQAKQDAAAWAQRQPRPSPAEDGRRGRPELDSRGPRPQNPGSERRHDGRGQRPPRREGAPAQGRGPRPAGKPQS